MMFVPRRVVFLLIAAMTVPVYAQQQVGDAGVLSSGSVVSAALPDLKFERFTTEDGAPGNGIDAFAQDSLGFLWIGTRNGLFRYDGESFEGFSHEPGDSTSLSNQWIYELYVDSDGTLWIGSAGGGLSRFDYATETFQHYRRDPANPSSLSSNHVSRILEDEAGSLWIGTMITIG